MLINMLYLKQIHLVHQYFETIFQTKEDFKPLYFAVLHLLENKDQGILRMPPEINEIVMDIVNDVKSNKPLFDKINDIIVIFIIDGHFLQSNIGIILLWNSILDLTQSISIILTNSQLYPLDILPCN